MTSPLPYGLHAAVEIEVVANDPVWVATIRRAVSRMENSQRPRIKLESQLNTATASCVPLVFELPAELRITMQRLANLRRLSPARLAVGLWPRSVDLLALETTSVDLHHWLTGAGASTVIYSPRETQRLSRILSRVIGPGAIQRKVDSVRQGGARLPAGWQ